MVAGTPARPPWSTPGVQSACPEPESQHGVVSAWLRLAASSAQVTCEDQDTGDSAGSEKCHRPEKRQKKIKEQAKQFKGKEYQDAATLAAIDFDKVIQDIDLELWSFVWRLLYGSTQENKPARTQDEHTLRLRCLHIISSMLHASMPSCTYPLYTLLTDVVEAHSKSASLVKILAQFGVVAARDTHSRYKMSIINERQRHGMQAELCWTRFASHLGPPNFFFFAGNRVDVPATEQSRPRGLGPIPAHTKSCEQKKKPTDRPSLSIQCYWKHSFLSVWPHCAVFGMIMLIAKLMQLLHNPRPILFANGERRTMCQQILLSFFNFLFLVSLV